MTHVCEEDTFGTRPSGKSQGFVYEHVGVVCIGKAQSIHHKTVDVLQKVEFFFGDSLHVGNIGKLPNLEAKNGELVVHNP